MSKKLKIVVAVVAAVVLVSVVGVAVVATDGGTLTASGNVTAPGTSGNVTRPNHPFLSRLAQLLGKTDQQVADAMTQARGEMRDQAFFKLLDRALQNGKLSSQAEEDSIKAWWQAKPAAADKLGFVGGIFGFNMSQTFRDAIVQKGIVTATDSQAIQDWWATRPVDAVDKVTPFMQTAKTMLDRQKLKRDMRQVGRDSVQNFQNYLNAASANGTIGQDDPQAIMTWLKARPVVANKILRFGTGFTFIGPNWPDRLPKINAAIDQAVTNQRLTGDQSTQIKTWLGQRPAALDKLTLPARPAKLAAPAIKPSGTTSGRGVNVPVTSI